MFTRMLTGVIAAGALSIPLAAVASAKPPSTSPGVHGDVSISVNGVVKKQSSSNPATIAESTASTGGGANVAKAKTGGKATATDGSGNKATASNGSTALATQGDNN